VLKELRAEAVVRAEQRRMEWSSKFDELIGTFKVKVLESFTRDEPGVRRSLLHAEWGPEEDGYDC